MLGVWDATETHGQEFNRRQPNQPSQGVKGFRTGLFLL